MHEAQRKGGGGGYECVCTRWCLLGGTCTYRNRGASKLQMSISILYAIKRLPAHKVRAVSGYVHLSHNPSY